MKPKSLRLGWLAILLAIRVAAAQAQERGRDPSDALFDPGRVIQIEIRLDPKDRHELRIGHRSRDEATGVVLADKPYEYYKADGPSTDGSSGQSACARDGGLHQPSLKVKLDQYVKEQEFASLNMLAFNNNYQDESQARQWLAYLVMNKAGVSSSADSLPRQRSRKGCRAHPSDNGVQTRSQGQSIWRSLRAMWEVKSPEPSAENAGVQ